MKKLVSFVLAALLMLSVVAFAASGDTTLEANPAITYTYSADNVNTGKVETYIYLKVKAEGQIDVTVPLFLVFATDVDGGKATEPSKYIIKNNNTESAVGVTKIAVTSGGGMKLTNQNGFNDAVGAHEYDTYMVTLTTSASTYDLGNAPFTQETAGAALSGFSIEKSESVNLKPEMQTTAIDFVTGDQYVQILTIEYTLGLIYDTVDTVNLPTASIVEPTPSQRPPM